MDMYYVQQLRAGDTIVSCKSKRTRLIVKTAKSYSGARQHLTVGHVWVRAYNSNRLIVLTAYDIRNKYQLPDKGDTVASVVRKVKEAWDTKVGQVPNKSVMASKRAIGEIMTATRMCSSDTDSDVQVGRSQLKDGTVNVLKIEDSSGVVITTIVVTPTPE